MLAGRFMNNDESNGSINLCVIGLSTPCYTLHWPPLTSIATKCHETSVPVPKYVSEHQRNALSNLVCHPHSEHVGHAFLECPAEIPLEMIFDLETSHVVQSFQVVYLANGCKWQKMASCFCQGEPSLCQCRPVQEAL